MPQHVRAHPGEHDVLAEALAALRADAMDEARTVEVEALFLTAAAVGHDERAAPLHTDEVEERQPRHAPEAVSVEEAPEPEPLDRSDGDRVVDEEQRRPLRRLGKHLERLAERPPLVQELEAMQRDDAEAAVRRKLGLATVLVDEREAVADRVRARVDDLAAPEVPRRPCPRRVVDPREPRRRSPVQLLRERVAKVVAPQPGLDVRDRNAERATHRRAEHRGHRVAVNEDEGTSGSRRRASAAAPLVAGERAGDLCEPARDVAVRPEVPAARAPREPDVRLTEPELLEECRNLLDLLSGRREEVPVPALVQAEQDGRELDQLARRPEDDEDHEASAGRVRVRIASPRHIPAPCAAAYTGASSATDTVSKTVRPDAAATAPAAAPVPRASAGTSLGRRSETSASAALTGKNALVNG